MHTAHLINLPEVVVSELFMREHVSVLLEWSGINGVIFDVSVTPHVVESFAQSTSFQLTVSYNTQYNVSVMASLCGQNNTTVTELHYGEFCIHTNNNE